MLKAGAAAGGALAAGSLPESLLDVLAQTSQCGTLADIEHVVILIQENRSFDHYFGRYKGVRGYDDRSVGGGGGAAIYQQSFNHSSAPSIPDPLIPFHIDTSVAAPGPRPGECTNDVGHQWADQHNSWNDGALNNWMPDHIGADGPIDAPIVMGYYDRRDIPFYYALADNFTICDHYHCSVIGGTDINRLYSITGTCDPDGWDGGLQFLDTRVTDRQSFRGSFGTNGKWRPYPLLLENAGVSWKIYSTPDGDFGDNDLFYFAQFQDPSSDLFQRAFSSQAFPNDFIVDALTGQLPQVSWLLSSLPDTEHAPGPLEWGQDITSKVVTALVNSPLWPKTALMVTYDENGGFFDHVPPPVPPGPPDPLSAGEYLAHADGKNNVHDPVSGRTFLGPIGVGFRVPMLVISPFSRNTNPGGLPLVCSDSFDHTSLLRFIETRFGVPIQNRDPGTTSPGLSPWRRQVVGDLTSAFNFAAGPLTSAPSLPLTNRADPRVLAECIITLTPLTLVPQTAPIVEGYPVSDDQTMPSQEGHGKRTPSGPVSQATCPPLPAPSPNPSGSPGTAANQANGPVAGPPAQLPNTAAQSPLPALGVLGGAAMAASGWWAARRRANEIPDRT